MNAIWKFKLAMTDRQTIAMPMGSSILSVQTQKDDLCIWAIVDPSIGVKEEHVIDIFGTGHNFDPDVARHFIGTIQMAGGNLVFHVFETLK